MKFESSGLYTFIDDSGDICHVCLYSESDFDKIPESYTCIAFNRVVPFYFLLSTFPYYAVAFLKSLYDEESLYLEPLIACFCKESSDPRMFHQFVSALNMGALLIVPADTFNPICMTTHFFHF